MAHLNMTSPPMPLGEPGYNGGPARTPHLDAMSTAPGAMQLSRFYCGGAVCSPTRASHLTGRTPNRVCMWDWINLDTHMHLPGMLTQGGPQDWAAHRTPVGRPALLPPWLFPRPGDS